MRSHIILLLVILAGAVSSGMAQDSTEKQRALALLRAVAERYHSSQGLQFSITYRYAAEDHPGIWLDSLKGNFSTSDDNYHYTLDSTEYFGGKDLSVVLFKQDQLMYLTKGNNGMQTGNPLQLLDSTLLKDKSIECHIIETNDWQTITLSFHPVRTTKRIEYVIDKRTGFVSKMSSVVPAKELYDASVKDKVADNGVYAIVETDLTHYRASDPGEKTQDIRRLFKKEGKEYVPLPPYESYKIFLGSPDL